jgi:hypothetical protein
VHVLADRGLLDYHTPVAEYWPQFATHGKQNITVAHVLAHTAGVPLAPAGLTPDDLADWEGVCDRIAQQPPIWEPGTATGYHSLTFGYILGEVIRRVTGRPPGQVLHEEIAIPLHVADDLFFGVPAGELPRVAHMEDGTWTAAIDARPDDSPFLQVAPRPLQPRADLGNWAGYLTADVPCAGTMTAAALARMYAALIGEVGGIRLIAPERLPLITTVITADTDRFLGAAIRKGLGYFLGLPEMGPRPEAFGCKGSGGSSGFADPARGFASSPSCITASQLRPMTPSCRSRPPCARHSAFEHGPPLEVAHGDQRIIERPVAGAAVAAQLQRDAGVGEHDLAGISMQEPVGQEGGQWVIAIQSCRVPGGPDRHRDGRRRRHGPAGFRRPRRCRRPRLRRSWRGSVRGRRGTHRCRRSGASRARPAREAGHAVRRTGVHAGPTWCGR